MRKKFLRLFEIGEKIARKRRDQRGHFHAAVGIRRDGAIVHAVNGPSTNVMPEAHAERRLVSRLGAFAEAVIVVRVRADGVLTNSRPCPHCEAALRVARVKSVFFSTEDGFEVI